MRRRRTRPVPASYRDPVPFTGSHPAAVLPLLGVRLLGRPLPASALVLGSMAPDLPYYEPFVTGPTHSALGIVTIDLLLGGAAWLIWHALLAAPALAVPPLLLRARLVGRVEPGLGARLAGPGQAALVLLALVLGAASHVGWDELTHRGRFGPRHLAFLARSWHGHPGYGWAQYASGVLGALALATWTWHWWRTSPARPVPTTRAPGPVCAGLVVVGAGSGAWAALTSSTLRDAAFHGVTTGAACALATAVALALLWHLARLHRRRTA